MNMFRLYTDGGAWPNPGPGAWAFILEDDKGVVARKCEYEKKTTNNRMELSAVINGLKDTPIGSDVVLTSDSQYVVKGIMQWRYNWIKKNWNGVLNDDLWKELSGLVDERKVNAVWIRGHNGHPQNEEADSMCSICMQLNS